MPKLTGVFVFFQGICVFAYFFVCICAFAYLASQDALEVMRVTYLLTHSLTYSLTYSLSVSIDFTDVTLVSDDTYGRLD